MCALVGVVLVAVARREAIIGVALGLAVIVASIAATTSAPSFVWQTAQIYILVLVGVAASRRLSSGSGSPMLPRVLLVIWASLGGAVSLASPSAGPSLMLLATLATLALGFLAVSPFSIIDQIAFSRLVALAVGVQLVITLAQFSLGVAPIWGYRNQLLDGTDVVRMNPFLGDQLVRAQGTTGHPIPLAFLAGISVILCVSGALRVRRTWTLIATMSSVTMFILAGTRSAVLGLVVALFFLFWHRFPLRRVWTASLSILLALVIYLTDPGVSDIVSDLLGSASFAHRFSLFDSVPSLLNRPLNEVLFGAGIGGEYALFGQGYLQQDGFAVIDNQIVSLFVSTGLVGTVLFLGALIALLASADAPSKSALIFVLVMFFSFDPLKWTLAWSLTVALLAWASGSAVVEIDMRSRQYATDATRGGKK